MVKTGVTVLDATREWVGQFNAIPYAVVDKLAKLDIDSIHEITPPSKHDRVYITDGEHQGEEGEILRVSDDDDEVYVVELDGSREEVEISQDDFEVQNDGFLPMWGTMWTFGESIDDGWLDYGDGLQAMTAYRSWKATSPATRWEMGKMRNWRLYESSTPTMTSAASTTAWTPTSGLSGTATSTGSTSRRP